MLRFRFIPEDPNQALRVRRYLIASGTTLLVVLLFCICYLAGLMPAWVLAGGVAFAVSRVALFYLLFRTGLNQRFADASLTTEQILLATLNVAFVMFFAEQTRGALLPVYVVPFLFGVFRLRTKEFFILGLVVLLVFGSMQYLSWRLGYAKADHVRDFVEFAVVAVVVPWFALFGGYVNSLRAELSASNRKLKSALEQIEKIAIRDELTGLYNRRFLMEFLERETSRAQRGGGAYSICMLDIDHFKNINDEFGHGAGDSVLHHFAAVAGEGMRNVDVFGRFGGEEFLVVFPETEIEGAVSSAERLRKAVELGIFPGLPEGRRVTVTAGVARSRPKESPSALLARADKALYEGKAGGRNRVVSVG